MATKTTFTVDSTSISNAFSNLFSYITEARFKVINKKGKSIISAPLYLALILGIFMPFLTVAVILIVLVMSYQIAIEKNEESKLLHIDKK